ncbi:uncharacterized protein [Montipora foliosa]|uniref:uncharacterized protein n=1 Tax=Montipora foliosa TaxID=591990 RepID=UPI0035F15906
MSQITDYFSKKVETRARDEDGERENADRLSGLEEVVSNDSRAAKRPRSSVESQSSPEIEGKLHCTFNRTKEYQFILKRTSLVLGGLSAVGIDVSQEWVKALCKRAPSLLALPRLSLSSLEACCKGAEKGDMDEVHRLIEYAESQRPQLADTPQDQRLVKEDKDSKALDQEKLTRVRELMTEAKAMAKDQSEQAKRTAKKKLNEILNVLELPQDWLKEEGVAPEELFKQLQNPRQNCWEDYISEECSSVVESGESYKSGLEAIAKASGGKALCGIYHSDYEAPHSAQIPLFLLPKNVKLQNPSSAQEIKYLKFSKKGMASEYARMVESSSTNVGIGVAGFYGAFVGECKGGYGQDQYSQSDQASTSSRTSASVLQYIRTAKKTFRLDPYQSIISLTARKMAWSIVDNANDAEVEQSARFFMKRYGSHYPAGIQSLGGVFFSIVDAESNSSKDTFTLTEAAENHLNTQISAGFLGGAFGIEASGTGEHTASKGQNKGRQASTGSDSFTYSVKSMGPQATNPSTFHKLLSYNSTWALIDRGECQSFIPVWELFSNLGGEFKEVATVLQKTWRKDEAERKTKWEAEHKKREKQLEDVREELVEIKDEHLKRSRGIIKGFWPNNGMPHFTQDSMLQSDAYDKAIKLIVQDPEHNICEITWWFGWGYTLKCWRASDTTPTTFGCGKGDHVLFFSELLFKWKDSVPLRG